jgi:hypothetical protein
MRLHFKRFECNLILEISLHSSQKRATYSFLTQLNKLLLVLWLTLFSLMDGPYSISQELPSSCPLLKRIRPISYNALLVGTIAK